jgi:hypothetical protein
VVTTCTVGLVLVVASRPLWVIGVGLLLGNIWLALLHVSDAIHEGPGAAPHD